jgi:energy-coupling factor transport system permease protein
MISNISLGRFYPASSLLHRLDPRTKILAAILMMAVTFLSRDLLPMAYLGLVTVGLIGLSRVPVKQVLVSLRPMLFILLFAVVLNI